MAEEELSTTSRVAAQTRRQLQELAAGLPNDTSEAVHEWPNGWSVRRPATYADTDRMGQLMGNCWSLKSIYAGGYAGAYDNHPDWPRNPYQDGSGHYPVDLIDANQYEQISGNLGIPIEPRSGRRVLADPDGIPHVAWSEGNGQIWEPLGRHNSDLKPEYAQMVRDYAAAHNIEASVVDDYDTLHESRTASSLDDALSRYQQLGRELYPDGVWDCHTGANALTHLFTQRGINAETVVGRYWHPDAETKNRATGDEGQHRDELHYWSMLDHPEHGHLLVDPNGEVRGEPRAQPVQNAGEHYQGQKGTYEPFWHDEASGGYWDPMWKELHPEEDVEPEQAAQYDNKLAQAIERTSKTGRDMKTAEERPQEDVEHHVIVPCHKCGAPMYSHEACPSCGYIHEEHERRSVTHEDLDGVFSHVAQQNGWNYEGFPTSAWHGPGHRGTFTTPSNGSIMARIEPHPEHGSIHLSSFGRNGGQPGEGAQFMNGLKSYADQAGENLTWDAYNDVGSKFYDKLGWNLQKTPWSHYEDDQHPRTPYSYQYQPQPAWNVEQPTTEQMLTAALNDRPALLPKHTAVVGSSTVEWWEANPGEAIIMATGGSADDRTFAEQYTKIALAAFGIKRVAFTFEDEDAYRKTASWNDIMVKAKRLIQSHQVTMLRNGWNNIIGHIIGDHGEYDTEIGRDDPNSNSITTWQCQCPWDQYAWQRTRKWKRLEGRPCAHVLALYWASKGTPLDDYDPNTHGPLPPGQKQGPPPGPQGPPLSPPSDQPPEPPQPPGGEGATEMGPGPQAPLTAPPGAPGTLPPAPMDQLQQQMAPPPMPGLTPPGAPAPPGSVSVPGARLPSPFNPVQYPGGTYSKTAAGEPFINGEIIRTTEDAYGLMEGREGATDAGQYHLIPADTTGEVLGQDPTTGWVEVIFPLEGGPMTSYHARCFLEPNQVKKTRIRPPGPMIQRRR